MGLIKRIIFNFKNYNVFRPYCNFSTDLKTNVSSKLLTKNIKTILATCGENDEIEVKGWVHTYRKQKQWTFLDINDGSTFNRLPVVISTSKLPDTVSMYSSLLIKGIIKRHPKKPDVLELYPNSDIIVLGECDSIKYPFGGKNIVSPDHFRQYPHLRPKNDRFASMLRLKSATSRAISDYFNDNDFVEIHTPILTTNDCEGAGEVFTVMPLNKKLIKDMVNENTKDKSPEEIFFEKKTFLTVSSQLHLESVTRGIDKVWTFSPVFRAENNKTTRHLCEFYMVEAEMSFLLNIEELLATIENLVKYVLTSILNKHIDEWNFCTKSDLKHLAILEKIVSAPMTIMTLDEAIKLLQNKLGIETTNERGLNREQELLLVEKLNDNIPIFVIDWPSKIKPFYMRETPNDPSKVSAVDLLVPLVGELAGGSLRENDLQKLISKISHIDPSGDLEKSLDWYLDLRKFGGVPSGGFGLGFERLIQLLLNNPNIRDISLFPRWPHNCPM